MNVLIDNNFGPSGLISAYGFDSGFRGSRSANIAAPKSAHNAAAAAAAATS